MLSSTTIDSLQNRSRSGSRCSTVVNSRQNGHTDWRGWSTHPGTRAWRYPHARQDKLRGAKIRPGEGGRHKPCDPIQKHFCRVYSHYQDVRYSTTKSPANSSNQEPQPADAYILTLTHSSRYELAVDLSHVLSLPSDYVSLSLPFSPSFPCPPFPPSPPL